MIFKKITMQIRKLSKKKKWNPDEEKAVLIVVMLVALKHAFEQVCGK